MRADHVPPELTHDPVAQDVHHLAQCRGQPNRMWVQHHNGIFISNDEGRTFREITDVKPSVFGFAVAAHPTDPETAWFVPEIKDEKRIPVDGKLVVTRTRDGGKSFQVLSDGLPQNHAYDVIYRHALAIDNQGDCLAIGSTTGGLWVSETQGDKLEVGNPHTPARICCNVWLDVGADRMGSNVARSSHARQFALAVGYASPSSVIGAPSWPLSVRNRSRDTTITPEMSL